MHIAHVPTSYHMRPFTICLVLGSCSLVQVESDEPVYISNCNAHIREGIARQSLNTHPTFSERLSENVPNASAPITVWLNDIYLFLYVGVSIFTQMCLEHTQIG